MTLSLSNLHSATGSTHSRKRVGRGNASGHGTYSTRGLKGQKSRSGVSGLTKLGMKKMLLSTPKLRGFKSLNAKNQAVNLSTIDKTFSDGAVISPVTLAKAGLIKSSAEPVKILGTGELTKKNLVFKNVKVSSTAVEAIAKAGGSVK